MQLLSIPCSFPIDPIGDKILASCEHHFLTGSKSCYCDKEKCACFNINMLRKYIIFANGGEFGTYTCFMKTMYIDSMRRYDSLYCIYKNMLQKRCEFQSAAERGSPTLENYHASYLKVLLHFHQICKYVYNDCLRLNKLLGYATLIYTHFIKHWYKYCIAEPRYCNNLTCSWYSCPLHF